jgi:hypothetical protein
MSSLPLSWIETLFARFAAAWGAQKIGAMFPADSHDAVKAMWANQLGRFEAETLRHALQSCIDSGREWPPTLPEFVAACQRSAIERRAHAPAVALPLPQSTTDVAVKAISEAAAAFKRRGPSRAWADRILARHAAGEHVPMVSLEMASRAKGAPKESA